MIGSLSEQTRSRYRRCKSEADEARRDDTKIDAIIGCRNPQRLLYWRKTIDGSVMGIFNEAAEKEGMFSYV